MGTNFLTPLLGYKILYIIFLSRILRMNTDIIFVYRGAFARLVLHGHGSYHEGIIIRLTSFAPLMTQGALGWNRGIPDSAE